MWRHVDPVGAVCDRPPTPRRPVRKNNSAFKSSQDTALQIRPQGFEKFGDHDHGRGGTGAYVGALDKDRMPPREPMFNDGHGNKNFDSTQQIPIILIVGLPDTSRFVTHVTLLSIGPVETAYKNRVSTLLMTKVLPENFEFLLPSCRLKNHIWCAKPERMKRVLFTNIT